MRWCCGSRGLSGSPFFWFLCSNPWVLSLRSVMNSFCFARTDLDARPWDFQAEECALRANIERFNSRRYDKSNNNPDFLPVDNCLQSVLGQRVDLPEDFQMNYDLWLEREVFSNPISWEELLQWESDGPFSFFFFNTFLILRAHQSSQGSGEQTKHRRHLASVECEALKNVVLLKWFPLPHLLESVGIMELPCVPLTCCRSSDSKQSKST